MGTEILSHLNWLAIIVASLAFFALGALWYSKLLFVDAWIRMTKVRTDDPNAKKGMGQLMLASLVLTIIACTGQAIILSKVPVVTMMSGVKVGLLVGLCFSATAISVSYIYERRPIGLHFINGGYNIAGSIVAGIILASWR